MFDEPLEDDALFEKHHEEISKVLQSSVLEIVYDSKHMKIFKFLRPDGITNPYSPIRISIIDGVVTINYYGNIFSFYNEGLYGSSMIKKFDEHDLSKIILSLPTSVKVKEYCSETALKKLDELIVQYLEGEEEGSSEDEEVFLKVKEGILDEICLEDEHSFVHTISQCSFVDNPDYYDILSDLEREVEVFTNEFKKYAQLIHMTSSIYKDFKKAEMEMLENENT